LQPLFLNTPILFIHVYSGICIQHIVHIHNCCQCHPFFLSILTNPEVWSLCVSNLPFRVLKLEFNQELQDQSGWTQNHWWNSRKWVFWLWKDPCLCVSTFNDYPPCLDKAMYGWKSTMSPLIIEMFPHMWGSPNVGVSQIIQVTRPF